MQNFSIISNCKQKLWPKTCRHCNLERPIQMMYDDAASQSYSSYPRSVHNVTCQKLISRKWFCIFDHCCYCATLQASVLKQYFSENKIVACLYALALYTCFMYIQMMYWSSISILFILSQVSSFINVT